MKNENKNKKTRNGIVYQTAGNEFKSLEEELTAEMSGWNGITPPIDGPILPPKEAMKDWETLVKYCEKKAKEWEEYEKEHPGP